MTASIHARLTVAALLLAAAPTSSAQGPDRLSDYTVTTLADQDGLPAGRVAAITQDADGYLWLGTDSGVVRFDGIRFVSWEALGLPTLPHGSVLTLLSASDRSVWIGFEYGGVARLRDRKLEVFTDPKDVGQAYAYSLLEDHAGDIWVASREGLHTYSQGRWTTVTGQLGLPSGKEILAISEDRRHTLWVATRDAVYRRATGATAFEYADAVEAATMLYPWFSEDSSGRMWITDLQHGFRRVGEKSPDPSSIGIGVQLLHDKRGNLWVGTAGDGVWFVRDEESPRALQIERSDVAEGSLGGAVNALFEDRDGNVWVGRTSGLQRFSHRRVSTITELGVPGSVVSTPDGSVWAATGRGVARFTKDGRSVYGEAEGLPERRVLSLHVDRSGQLWAITIRGMARFENGRFTPVEFPGVERLVRLSAMAVSPGSTWFQDLQQGIFQFRDGQLRRVDQLPAAFSNRVFDLRVDRQGVLWVASTGGLLGAVQADGRVQTYVLPIGDLSTIVEARDGSLWVGGRHGLSRVDRGRISTIDRRSGFPGNVVSVAEDADGVLWMGADRGIVRLERSEFDKAATQPSHQVRFAILDSSDGTAGSPLRGRSRVAVDGTGRLWFATSNGVTIVDPMDPDVLAPSLPTAAVIEAITADGRLRTPASGLELASGTSHLQIDYTALDLTHPMRTRFRYRLDGVDEAWINAGNARRATYTNLSAGKYRFRLMATNGSGEWTERETTLGFSIAPTFYQTKTFYALCVLALALATWGVYQVRMGQIRRQLSLVLAERVRMSRAIHDTLLQGMAAMALQFDHLAQTPAHPPDVFIKLRKRMEEYVREARQSIWDLRSPMLAQHDFVTALRSAAQRIVSGSEVEFEFVVTGTPHPCSSKVEDQLLSLAQEALSNAVRHARPTRVRLVLDYSEQGLQLVVTDDGCGFDVTKARHADRHYGLQTMQEHADEAHAALTVTSSPGSGTKVQVVVPLTEAA